MTRGSVLSSSGCGRCPPACRSGRSDVRSGKRVVGRPRCSTVQRVGTSDDRTGRNSPRRDRPPESASLVSERVVCVTVPTSAESPGTQVGEVICLQELRLVKYVSTSETPGPGPVYCTRLPETVIMCHRTRILSRESPDEESTRH